MPCAEFASDFLGKVAFTSGYALDASRLTDCELRCGPAVVVHTDDGIRTASAGPALHSGWFRLLKHQLRTCKTPALSSDALPHAVELATAFHRTPSDTMLLTRLDRIVSNTFGLNRAHEDAISEILCESHSRSVPKQSAASGGSYASNSAQSNVSQFEPVRLQQGTSLHRERPDLRQAVTFVPNKTAPIHRWYKFHTRIFSRPSNGAAERTTSGPSAHRARSICRMRHDEPRLSTTRYRVDRLRGFAAHGVDCTAKGKLLGFGGTQARRGALKTPTVRRHTDASYRDGVFGEYLAKAYAPLILKQLWSIFRYIDRATRKDNVRNFLKLGLLSIMEDVSQIRKHGSHYRFMLRTESAGLQKLYQIVADDTDIRPILRSRLEQMIQDVETVRFPSPISPCDIRLDDARASTLKQSSVDAIIGSPPYLNRNNYIAQQKAELALLSFVRSSAEFPRSC